MKVLFLDIDGVLHTAGSITFWKKHGIILEPKFDIMACHALQWILTNLPETKIVISSTWRKMHTMNDLKNILNVNGVDGDRIIGITPTIKSPFADERSKEISEWLSQHEVDDYVIIDDIQVLDHGDHLVWVDSYVGLTFRDAANIYKKFGGEYPVFLL
jgi:hypothetical protein